MKYKIFKTNQEYFNFINRKRKNKIFIKNVFVNKKQIVLIYEYS